jgi:hypothetical protein
VIVETDLGCLKSIYRLQKNSIPTLYEVIRGTKTKICSQGTVCWRFILAVLWAVRLGLTKVGNQVKPLKYSEK